jgi:hypothetical protein
VVHTSISFVSDDFKKLYIDISLRETVRATRRKWRIIYAQWQYFFARSVVPKTTVLDLRANSPEETAESLLSVQVYPIHCVSTKLLELDCVYALVDLRWKLITWFLLINTSRWLIMRLTNGQMKGPVHLIPTALSPCHLTICSGIMVCKIFLEAMRLAYWQKGTVLHCRRSMLWFF